MPLGPVALYGLEVPPGDFLVPATPHFPASFRITMAAIDPSAKPQVEDGDEEPEEPVIPRATLKIVRVEHDYEDDEDNEEYMRALLESDTDDSESDEEANGGPSDPSKSKKARKQAALEQLMESIKNDADSDEEMENAANGTKVNKKGKAKATSDGEDSEGESDDDGEELDESEEFVLCTLDPEKHYQQTLDITVAENEKVYFKVSGTHAVYITGNFLLPDEDGHNRHKVYNDSDDSDDGEYDLTPDQDELELLMDGDESDELDEFENPRITEVESEDEAPKLVAKATKAEKKGKNKRSADEIEGGSSLDDIIAKSVKPEPAEEPKLSKKQLKKLKKNNGEAAAVKVEDSTPKSDKKVQFAKNLEQGPTGTQEKAKPAAAASPTAPKLVNTTVNGVKVEDKKLGKGPACKKGNKVGMRYIGKLLSNGKVFDSNKSGKPFSFKLGEGEVIKGWDIGVAGMAVGGERRLTIPASLAYKSSSVPGIPPNSTLVFDIKCLEIK